MRLNFSSEQQFDNSSAGALERKELLLHAPELVRSFNNDISVTTSKPYYIYNDTAEFDNSVSLIEAIRSSKLKARVATSGVSEFDNSKVERKKPVIANSTDCSVFNNKVKQVLTVDREKMHLSSFSGVGEFENHLDAEYVPYDFNFSQGVLELVSHIDDLMYDEYDYEVAGEDLIWTDLEYNYFDNSIPSITVKSQVGLIAQRAELRYAEFSLNFPANPIELQFNIDRVSKSYPLEQQVYATYPMPTDDGLEQQVYAENAGVVLELQVQRGEISNELLEHQVNTLRGSSIWLEQQMTAVKPRTVTLNMQVNAAFGLTEELEQQINVPYMLKDKYLEHQFTRVYRDEWSIEQQFNMNETIRLERLEHQVFNTCKKDMTLEHQFTRVYRDQWNVEQQVRAGFANDDEIEHQVSVMDFDKSIEQQFKIQFTDEFVLEKQINIDHFNKKWRLELQSYNVVNKDCQFEQQFNKEPESSTKAQVGLIPVGEKNLRTQFLLKSSFIDILEQQVNVSIETDEVLEQQFVQKRPIDEWLEQEVHIGILLDDTLEAQIDVVNVSKDYQLEHQIDVGGVEKDYVLEIQSIVDTVNRRLELQFDVIDLVYYIINKGWNMLPWYSSGLGEYNIEYDKNWNKDDTIVTTSDNLLVQLDDIEDGIIIDSYVNYTDNMFTKELEAVNTELIDNIVKLYKNEDTTELVVLGKRKSNKDETVSLHVGKNIVVIDSANNSLKELVLDVLEDKVEYVLKWDPKVLKFEKVLDESEVYFMYDDDGRKLKIPYVFFITVNEDCEFTYSR